MNPKRKARVGGANLLRNDPDAENWVREAAENPAALSKKQKRDRARIRVKYDLDPALKIAIEKIANADHEDTSASQAAALLLAWAVQAYSAGDAQLHETFQTQKMPSRTPKFAWNIEIPDDWARKIEQFSTYGAVSGDSDVPVGKTPTSP